MTPLLFEGFQRILGAPIGWDVGKHGPCDGLPIRCDGGVCLSVWKPTWGERLSLMFGGRVQVQVASGNTQPAIAIHATRLWPELKP